MGQRLRAQGHMVGSTKNHQATVMDFWRWCEEWMHWEHMFFMISWTLGDLLGMQEPLGWPLSLWPKEQTEAGLCRSYILALGGGVGRKEYWVSGNWYNQRKWQPIAGALKEWGGQDWITALCHRDEREEQYDEKDSLKGGWDTESKISRPSTSPQVPPAARRQPSLTSTGLQIRLLREEKRKCKRNSETETFKSVSSWWIEKRQPFF